MNGVDWWLLVTLLVLTGLAGLAWSVRALDAPGAVIAFLLGLWVAVAASIQWLLLMTVFTAIGVLATGYRHRQKQADGLAEAREGERSWQNVVANGAAAALAVLALVLLDDELAATIAFATAVAAVSADTLASELGVLAPRARRILPPFQAQKPGTNGAVSLQGQLAAAVGALVIAVAAVWLIGLPAQWAWVPAVAGFFGCQVDSMLGATLERDELHDRPLSKQDVNFLASALPALVVLVAFAAT